MAANPNNPIALPDGRTAYEGVCDVCGKLCVQWIPDPLSIPAPEKIHDMVGRSPQLCNDHAPSDSDEPAAQPVPETITPAQLRIAARRVLGIPRATLEATVEEIIAGIADPEAQDDARDKWDLATVIERNHPLIDVVRQAFGKTEAEVDQMFRVGATL